MHRFLSVCSANPPCKSYKAQSSLLSATYLQQRGTLLSACGPAIWRHGGMAGMWPEKNRKNEARKRRVLGDWVGAARHHACLRSAAGRCGPRAQARSLSAHKCVHKLTHRRSIHVLVREQNFSTLARKRVHCWLIALSARVLCWSVRSYGTHDFCSICGAHFFSVNLSGVGLCWVLV